MYSDHLKLHSVAGQSRGSMYKYKQRINPRTGKIDMIYRIIAEQYLNRPLLESEVVHHKDGNPNNNNIENLEIMTRSEHAKLHHIPKKLISLTCPICKIEFTIAYSQYKKRSKHSTCPVYCSRSCSGKTRNPPHIRSN